MKTPLSRVRRPRLPHLHLPSLPRRTRPTPTRKPRRPRRAASHPTSHHVPWWVRWFTNAGRPVVAVVVLIMCAPGEHHLAVLAGWDTRLAWGMAAVLAAYAGIAASVASNRPAGAPGKKSAVAGAVVSLGAAMAAQPVSHMFVTGHWSAEPYAPVWLVVAVSCVPPLVFGHLLHLAATPTAKRSETPAETALAPAIDAAIDTAQPPVPAVPWPGAAPAGVTLLPIVARDAETTDRDDRETDRDDDKGRRLIATREVAALCNVKPSTVRTWVDRGRLTPVVRDARDGMLFDRDDVAALA